MPPTDLKCRACGSPIPASEFSYVIRTPGPPEDYLCSLCVSRDGMGRYPQVILVLPDDLSDFQKSLLCNFTNTRRDGPAEIAEREVTALARRMLAEMPEVNETGDTLGAKARASVLVKLAKSGISLDIRGDTRAAVTAEDPYAFVCGTDAKPKAD